MMTARRGRMAVYSCKHREKPKQSRIAIHDSATEFRIALEGSVTPEMLYEAEQCWRTAESTIRGRAFVVDLRNATFVHEEDRELMTRLDEGGARFLAADAWKFDLITGDSGLTQVATASSRRLTPLEVLACMLVRLRNWIRTARPAAGLS